MIFVFPSYSLVLRMDKLDTYLGIIIDKIELALNKLATVERTKSTKFESMNKILDAIIDENDESKFLK